MIKIITAIVEENILKKLIKNKIVENNNILYREAILDILKKNKNIDKIIISEKISGDIDFIKLIKKIKNINKKIEIIIILSKKEMEKELINLDIKNMYYNNFWNIYKLINNLKENKKEKNYLLKKINIKKYIDKIKENIKFEKKVNINNKNNIICIYGENQIDIKIIDLFIIKKLILENKKIIRIDLNINNKNKIKNQNKRKIKRNKIKNKYFLKLKKDYYLKEKIINKKIIKIININKILKNKNKLMKIKILKKIIKKYNKNNYFIILNICTNIEVKKLITSNTVLNIIVAENSKINLLKLNNNINKKINLVIINYNKNKLSKYFYETILKNKFNKIKIIN